jgi:branched-chain amino acid transport system permease protein
VTIIWSGLTVGAIYALIAIQYNIVFIATGIFNFAQAQLAISGTFLAYLFGSTLHLTPVVVIALCAISCAALSMLEEIMAVLPLQGRGYHGELVTTLGFAVVLEGVALVIWGSNPLAVNFPGSQQVLTVLGGRVLPDELVLVGATVVIMIALRVGMRRTKLGLAALAAAENRSAAMLRGVNVRFLSLFFFALAGAIAGATGIIVGPQTFAVYDGGNTLALMGFLALAIGGFGSQLGALVGGLGAGIIQALTERYLGSEYALLVLFALLVLLLLVRPQGLFGQGTLREV